MVNRDLVGNGEFPSTFELWEFVVSFEDGSLPLAAWNAQTLAVVAIWYLFLLPPSDAMARLELGLRRNQFRFGNRAREDGEVDSFGTLWPCVLRHVLSALGAGDALTIANRLMENGVLAARDRAA